MRKKAASLMEKIFGWGILLTLLAGGLAFLGYLAALAAGGGENGAGMRIALFIQKEYFPVVIVCAAISAAIGLLSLYLNGWEGLSLKGKQDEGEGEGADR